MLTTAKIILAILAATAALEQVVEGGCFDCFVGGSSVEAMNEAVARKLNAILSKNENFDNLSDCILELADKAGLRPERIDCVTKALVEKKGTKMSADELTSVLINKPLFVNNIKKPCKQIEKLKSSYKKLFSDKNSLTKDADHVLILLDICKVIDDDIMFALNAIN